MAGNKKYRIRNTEHFIGRPQSEYYSGENTSFAVYLLLIAIPIAVIIICFVVLGVI